jgi:hypothetical protein
MLLQWTIQFELTYVLDFTKEKCKAFNRIQMCYEFIHLNALGVKKAKDNALRLDKIR